MENTNDFSGGRLASAAVEYRGELILAPFQYNIGN